MISGGVAVPRRDRRLCYDCLETTAQLAYLLVLSIKT